MHAATHEKSWKSFAVNHKDQSTLSSCSDASAVQPVRSMLSERAVLQNVGRSRMERASCWTRCGHRSSMRASDIGSAFA